MAGKAEAKNQKPKAEKKAEKKEAKPEKAKTDKSSQKAVKAYITSFRRSLHRTSHNQTLATIDNIDTRAKAAQYIGKKVVWKTPGNREIFGKITSPHGNNGVIRIRFSRGVSGTILGKKVIVLGK